MMGPGNYGQSNQIGFRVLRYFLVSPTCTGFSVNARHFLYSRSRSAIERVYIRDTYSAHQTLRSTPPLEYILTKHGQHPLRYMMSLRCPKPTTSLSSEAPYDKGCN